MAVKEIDLPPRIYHRNDPDGIFALWKQLVQQVATDERTQAALYEQIYDPDTAPPEFVDLMLKALGNPFTDIYLTLTQKRKLVKTLVPIYKQKGTLNGVENAIRFLTGIIVDIVDPHGVDDDGWQVGLSEIGANTYAGGQRVYCNMLDWSEDFNDAVWVKGGGALVQSQAITGPNPWGRPADRLILTAAGSSISQVVTPIFVGNQFFTGSIFLKAAAPGTIEAEIYAESDPTDILTESLSVTTDWTRFDWTHQMDPNQSSPNVVFKLKSTAGFASNLYAFGAQFVRNSEAQAYAPTTDDGEDCEKPGKWAYHFLVTTGVFLTENEEAIIRRITDFMKPAHTHYTLIFPTISNPTPEFIDHWEVGESEVGYNTYVHS